MTNSPSLTEIEPNMVKKIFQCPICKRTHQIYFPPEFAKNRSKYPFTYIFIHSFQNADSIEDKDKDVLTTLYIDAHLNIRGVEAIIAEDDTNILSKEVSKAMVSKLTKVIMEMQIEHDQLAEKYAVLRDKYNELVKKN
ncbi:hypothetical protein NEF87_004672 [Candidatus Lokiarchaeum ossiferum]|uniref:CpXC domain-containing protein n=1 Tax=Candidatus Lokiarchaeum ossiferum TaxID=2951803 RepID=A0ABY6HZT3_9ARCH|nr:hypothetical protein NEF87_004672 [Candidatus Lokiarchaeum sp. B-35]